MIERTKAFFARRLLRQLIEIATETLYSEQFDMDAVVQKLSRNQGGIPLLRAYVAIQTAARLSEPLTDADVDQALEVVHRSEAHSESAVFRDILETHGNLAEVYWSQRNLAILQGKLAHKNDEESYEATVYNLQQTNKGPVSKEELAKCEPLCKKMADLKRQIEEAELKAWKEQDEEEYHRYKDELETRALSAEIDANEDERNRAEIAAVVNGPDRVREAGVGHTELRMVHSPYPASGNDG
jgi:hypothetical protein